MLVLSISCSFMAVTNKLMKVYLNVTCNSRIRNKVTIGGKVVSLIYRPLSPRKYSWYSFLVEAESILGP